MYEVLHPMTTDIQDNPRTKSPEPRKLNDGMITGICEAVAKGNYFVTACQLVGVRPETLVRWMHLADADEANGFTEDESLYIKLHKEVKRAEAIAEAKLVEVVREAAEVKREWLPAMTFLERRHPDRWGRKDRSQVTIDEHKTITITRVEVVKPEGYIDTEGRELLGEGEE